MVVFEEPKKFLISTFEIGSLYKKQGIRLAEWRVERGQE
jgi:hypothetical protein